MSNTPPPAKVASSDPLFGLRPDEINICMIDPKLREKVFHALNNPPPVESKKTT